MSNLAAFNELELDGAAPQLVALGATLAAEIDRQAAVGEGVNAALVTRYAELLGDLVAESRADPKADMLAALRDAKNRSA